MASLLAAAVVISRGDSETLNQTLSAISNQTHPLLQVVVVEQSDSIECLELAKSFGFGVVSNPQKDLASAIQTGVTALQGEANWLWILHHDTAPEPTALENLARAAEISPSVAIIGPKQLDWDHPIQIRQLGLTTTRISRPFTLVEQEYDQGQFDSSGDTMAVSTAGMLVAMGLWHKLGGLDSSSPSYAQDIEFCIKARALGYRVIVEPRAKVLSRGSMTSEAHSRRRIFGGRAQALAKAHVHLATIIWPGIWLPILYLAMPLIVLAAIPLNLLQKRPARIFGQVSAWVYSWATLPTRLRARRQVRSLGSLRSLEKLYATREQIQRRRSRSYEEEPEPEVRVKGLIESGGLWFSLLPLLAGFALFPTGAATRPGLEPLGKSLSGIWSNVAAQTQSYLDGVLLPSDPFNWFFALLAVIWPSSPTAAMAWFIFLSPSVLFIGSWFLFSLQTTNHFAKNAGSLVVSTLPPLLLLQRQAGVVELVAITASVWAMFFLAKSAFSFNLARAWRWLGLAGLAGSLSAISSPVSFFFLVVLSIALGLVKPRRFGVLIWFGTPGVLLLWPWLEFALSSGGFEFLTSTSAASLGPVDPYSNLAWLITILVSAAIALLAAMARPGLGAVALLSATVLFLVSTYQPISGSHALIVLALILLLVPVMLSLQEIGDRLRIVAITALFLAGGSGVAAAVLMPLQFSYGSERMVPALVMAQSDVEDATRTLRLSDNEGFSAELVWGDGRNQEQTSLLYPYIRPQGQIELELAQLAASLVAGNPDGVAELLTATGVDFVLLDPSVNPSVQIALNSMTMLQPSGQTDFGLLWRVTESNSAPAIKATYFPQRQLQLSGLVAFALLAIPTPGSITGRRLRRPA